MINIDKTQPRISLDKVVEILKQLQLELTWHPQTRSGDKYDLDIYGAVLGDKIPKDEDLVFHGCKKVLVNGNEIIMHPSGCILYSGDDQTGDSGEKMIVDFDKIPLDKNRIAFAIEIAHAEKRNQTFGDITAPKLALRDLVSGEIKATIDLDEKFTTERCMIPFEFYRGEMDNGQMGWKIKRIAQGYKNGTRDFLLEQGFEVEERKDY